jgi:ABC-2 type transport system ATP-binding protein
MVEDKRSDQPVDQLAAYVKDLSKKFGDEYAVLNLTFEVPRGKIFGFIGPSGSGKTTAIRLLTGIYEPTSGEAVVLGVNPNNFTPSLRERIGYMPQLFVLYPDLTIWENLNFTASIYGIGIVGRRKRLERLLEFVELSDHRNKIARNISGGMQRRLALAATLLHDPELIFLDEPTGGIDPILRSKFWEHFRELQKQGNTLFVTTQYVGEAAYCDYVGVLANGQLLMVETPEGLRRRAFGGEVIEIETESYLGWDKIGEIESLPFVHGKIQLFPNNTIHVTVDQASSALPDILDWFRAQNIPIASAKEFQPPFDDVFVKVVQEANNA